ncbi:hypothetical protein BRC81_14945 [Halobacteriales archaeon QS_1_68_20]|nr:MAG: hypothetical protein BRC81_14945 [Halobacteriales archaeon QS_1_68_20]
MDDAPGDQGQTAEDAGDRERLFRTVLDEYEAFTDQRIDREEYATLKQAIVTDVVPVDDADRSFFVVGSYGDEEEERLRFVADRLDSIGRPFLLKDLDAFDSLLLWTTEFKGWRTVRPTSSACTNTRKAATSGKPDGWTTNRTATNLPSSSATTPTSTGATNPSTECSHTSWRPWRPWGTCIGSRPRQTNRVKRFPDA